MTVPRLRMFGGPNGSGKTTVKNQLPSTLFINYINPDEIEASIQRDGVYRLDSLGINSDTEEIQSWFRTSSFLASQSMTSAADLLEIRDGLINFHNIKMNSYYASVLADFLRRKLLEQQVSFTFETVMSSMDKVELLRMAQNQGYRTYLYFVATENPSINIERVKLRVSSGGHDVPMDKIIARYHRSLNNLIEAIRSTNRAFIFDTSLEEPLYFAEITDGKVIDLKGDEMPDWFKTYVWDRF